MSDAESVTSESTLEPFQFEKVLESLESGAREAIESQDFISYSTLLDIYLSDPTKYTYDEREQLLNHLLTILTEHKQLTYEIGWDLPNLLILYVESDFQFHDPIRTAPCVYKILKNFEALALNGNPKELFLKCCELLTTVQLEDVTITDDISIQERFYDVKLYCIFELIDSCLKRIKTYYPSRFLAMTVAAYINSAYKNATNSASNTEFIMKRAYNFARNYASPPLPENDGTLTTDEIKKISADESYLQRKLLTGFLTSLVYFVSVNHQYGYAVDHFSFLQEPHRSSLKKYFEYEVESPVLDRIAELALSYDIELDQDFKQYIKEAHELVDEFKFDGTDHDDDISGDLFEKVVIDYQKNSLTTIITSDAKNINDSILGDILIYTHQIAVKRTFDRVSITFSDALVLTLRTIIPQMVQKSFMATGVQDAVVFWSWYSLYDAKDIEVAIATVPKTLLMIYYQALLFIIISSVEAPNFRYVVLTLLTKILALSPESTAYAFLKDSLINCPYERDKATLIGVLKELLTQHKQSRSVDSLSDQLASTTIDEEDETKPEVPPPLPNRSIPEVASAKYIQLTLDKFNDLTELINKAVEDVFVKQDSEVSIDPRKLSTLSAYLNLLVVIKNDVVVLANKKEIDAIVAAVKVNLEAIKRKHDQTPNSNVYELNAVGMLEITLDRIA
ncbi:YAP1 binding protein 2 [Scheffersomyces amazonensis]|uniref:YAP1 binding protein 2 n=1 Tax=Scheffersomyces amazonensis TaxID=1078765 RepID=UPI00315CE0E0